VELILSQRSGETGCDFPKKRKAGIRNASANYIPSKHFSISIQKFVQRELKKLWLFMYLEV
jgi:hypothetical protein